MCPRQQVDMKLGKMVPDGFTGCDTRSDIRKRAVGVVPCEPSSKKQDHPQANNSGMMISASLTAGIGLLSPILQTET